MKLYEKIIESDPLTTTLARVSDDTCQILDEEAKSFNLGAHSADKKYMSGGALRHSRTYVLRDSTAISQFQGDRLHEAPAFVSVLEQTLEIPPVVLSKLMGRCYYAELPSGAEIPAHTDIGPYFDDVIRLQLYLSAYCDGMDINAGGIMMTPSKGELIKFNHTKYHRYTNKSPLPMRFYVFDLYRKRE